jgi:VWFA-related protein
LAQSFAAAASGQSATPASQPAVQLTPRTPEERERDRLAALHLILNVAVTDGAGNPVTDLKQEDFTLSTNGQSQRIASLREVEGGAAAQFVHVLLVLDPLNNSSGAYATELKAVEKFLGASHGQLAWPTSIALVSASGLIVEPSSQNSRAILDLVRSLPKDTHARDRGLSLDELNRGIRQWISPDLDNQDHRFQQSLHGLVQLINRQINALGRAIVIWIGPGWPLLTDQGFVQDAPAMQRNLLDGIVDINGGLREAQVTLDMVASPDMLPETGYDRFSYYNAFLQPVKAPADAHAGNLSLPVLASQSGGQVLDRSKDIAGEIAACIADAGSYYVLSFDSSAAAQPDEYRTIEVKVDRPGLVVRANTGYYAEP